MPLLRLYRFFVTTRHTVARLPALISDARVPLRLKLLTLVVALLILSPLNILGDIPLLGIADDAALLGLLLNWFARTADRYLLPLPG